MRDLGNDTAARTAGAARSARRRWPRSRRSPSGWPPTRWGSTTRSGSTGSPRWSGCAGPARPRRAETVADFVVSQRAAAAERGVPAARRDRGLGLQVALARGVSPTRGQQDVALAMVLRVELPHTRAAFRAGRIDAFKATLIARETALPVRGAPRTGGRGAVRRPEDRRDLSPRRLVGPAAAGGRGARPRRRRQAPRPRRGRPARHPAPRTRRDDLARCGCCRSRTASRYTPPCTGKPGRPRPPVTRAASGS